MHNGHPPTSNVSNFTSLVLFKCNRINLLINVTLINIEQVRMVCSANLFKFVLVESTFLFRVEAPKRMGVWGQRP